MIESFLFTDHPRDVLSFLRNRLFTGLVESKTFLQTASQIDAFFEDFDANAEVCFGIKNSHGPAVGGELFRMDLGYHLHQAFCAPRAVGKGVVVGLNPDDRENEGGVKC